MPASVVGDVASFGIEEPGNRKIENYVPRAPLFDAVGALATWPDCQNVKQLVNHEYQYRLRAGRYRVFFDVTGDMVTIITIQEVKKRDEHTY